ncbi:hypothetical protein [uncultured Microbacterium sp.]|uniref:hypothetical protein n=1 Tax=uncultured Microbacterium sp. TaxID=191216 RepID=UPI0035CCA0B3
MSGPAIFILLWGLLAVGAGLFVAAKPEALVRLSESQTWRRRQPPPHTRAFRIWWNRIGGIVFVVVGITFIVLVVSGVLPPPS